MDTITLLDLFLMHVDYQKNHESNMDILQTMYERTHNYYIAVFSAVLVLAGGLIGSFIALYTHSIITSHFISGIVIITLIVLAVCLITLGIKIGQLQKKYLDILQVYNLLSLYF